MSAISHYPVPRLEDLPQDIRERSVAVQDKAGFVPNMFLTLAYRSDEFRAFFAYHVARILVAACPTLTPTLSRRSGRGGASSAPRLSRPAGKRGVPSPHLRGEG